MKTNYIWLKQWIFALALLTATTVVIYSCKKDKPDLFEELDSKLIKESRIYFEENVLNQSSIIDENIRHGLHKVPDWGKAVIKKISIGNAVIVPIRYDSDIFLKAEGTSSPKALKETSYLMIYRDGKKKLHAEWITLIPGNTEQYTEEKFIGTVTVEDWNGMFIKAFALGTAGEVMAVKLKESILIKNISFRRTDCYTIYYYGHNYVEGYPESEHWYENGSETYCFSGGGEQRDDTDDHDDSGGGGGGGGSGSGPGPSDYASVYDCNGDLNGSAYIDPNCGCIGGNTGKNACPTNEIKDSVDNPCIKNALALALSKNAVNEIKTMFYDTFGSNKNYNVVFTDGSLGTVTRNAMTSTGLDPKTGIMTSKIIFNTDVAGIRSEQYAVATVYHEMIHAELRKLFPENAQGKIIIPSQHEYMAQNYVNKLSSSLKSVFPALSDTDAWALSWAGLKQTSFFDLLSEANKTLVGETLVRYSDKDRYDKLGTYCR